MLNHRGLAGSYRDRESEALGASGERAAGGHARGVEPFLQQAELSCEAEDQHGAERAQRPERDDRGNDEEVQRSSSAAAVTRLYHGQ